nr:hypothetical protein [Phytohabitans rumicis]
MHCATCQAEMPFESLPYDEDGDELVCTGCGTAVVTAPITVRLLMRQPAGAGIAPQQRRAAA